MSWVYIDEKNASLLLASNPVINDDLRAKLEKIGQPRDPRDEQIIELAEAKDEEREIDSDAVVSEGDDNGAYIMTWHWVSFSGTPLDKEIEEDEGSDK